MDHANRLSVDAIQSPPTLSRHMDDACVKKHAQMLRNGRAAHSKGCGKLLHRTLTMAQNVEQCPSRRVGDGLEDTFLYVQHVE